MTHVYVPWCAEKHSSNLRMSPAVVWWPELKKAVKKTPKFTLLLEAIHKIGSQPSNKASGNKMEQYKNSQKSAH